MSKKRLLLSILPDESLARIEETAYRLLAEVGISMQHDGATEMLHGLGCRVDARKGRVLIPPETVQWALAQLKPHDTHYNRDGSFAFAFGDGAVRFHNGGGMPFVDDLETGQRRSATAQDAADMTRLLDALPHVDVVVPPYGLQDVPPQLLAVASTEVVVRNTRKPFSAAAIEKPEDVPYVVEMAAACCGGIEAYRACPTMSVSVSPVSPLSFTHDVVASIIAVAESGTPFHSLPAPVLGATAPITMAGALAQQHAEVLASFVLVAAVRPGLPVAYCSRLNPVDLRTAFSSWGGPEVGVAGACATQLANRLGLPCDAYGLCTSANRLDPQFSYERLSNAVIPALAGVDILSGIGATASGLSGGLEIAIIDNEMASLVKHIVAGIEVSDETLAFDVMQDVIPRDGIFLGEMHTVREMQRGAIWTPGVSSRSDATDEAMAGVVARARKRACELLNEHRVEPLREDVSRHLDDIMVHARRDLVKS